MSAVIDRLAAWRALPLAAALVTLAIGLVFIFVWAPHPWGWFGIDQYHQLAVELANGGSFQTFDVPWGYAYYLAPFYWLFGPTPLPALIVQALVNAAIPPLVYFYAVRAFDRRVAAVATVLVAVLSFNTVYVSTESTDSLSTAMFMAMLLAYVHGRRVNRDRWFVVAGILAGVAAQFRPNLVLLPFVLAALNWLLGPRTWVRVRQGAALALTAIVLLVPWVVRNYELSRQFLPTSTHGGIQLWYGTLQTGPYIESRAHNPRSVFATSPFDYTSLKHVPIEFDVWMNCAPGTPEAVNLHYRLDQGTFSTVAMHPGAERHYVGSIPAVGRDARVYYYVEVTWPSGVNPTRHLTPSGGPADPLIYFVSDRHTADLDVDDALLDIFDAVRLIRHIAWSEPVRGFAKLDRDGDGVLGRRDLETTLQLLLRGMDRGEPPTNRLRELVLGPERAAARFTDGSELVVPREWQGEITDLQVGIGAAENLMAGRFRFTQPEPEPRVPLEIQCLGPGEIAINRAYYRVQPHEQRRYVALALDNIRRGPVDYMWSVLYRGVRLFVILGTDDRGTAQQFDRSRLVYAVATLLSSVYLGLALIGAFLGWRRGYAVVLPVLLVLYIPATISFVLTNMRYTTTVQPLLFMFVGVTIVAAADWRRSSASSRPISR